MTHAFLPELNFDCSMLLGCSAGVGVAILLYDGSSDSAVAICHLLIIPRLLPLVATSSISTRFSITVRSTGLLISISCRLLTRGIPVPVFPWPVASSTCSTSSTTRTVPSRSISRSSLHLDYGKDLFVVMLSGRK